MPKEKPKWQVHWLIEQGILCAILAPMSMTGYILFHRAAFEPGSEVSGEAIFLAMGVAAMLGLLQYAGLLFWIFAVPFTAIKKRPLKPLIQWTPTVTLIILVGFVLPMTIGFDYRDGVVRLTKAGDLVVQEIELYREREGEYPESLKDVYGEEGTPWTGSRTYRNWEYKTDEEHGFELRVLTSSAIGDFDLLFYWPDQNYPDATYGGIVERFGEWAYIHE